MTGVSGPSDKHSIGSFLGINIVKKNVADIPQEVTTKKSQEPRSSDQLAGLGKTVARGVLTAAATPLAIPFALGFALGTLAKAGYISMQGETPQITIPESIIKEAKNAAKDLQLTKQLFQAIGSGISEAMQSKPSVSSEGMKPDLAKTTLIESLKSTSPDILNAMVSSLPSDTLANFPRELRSKITLETYAKLSPEQQQALRTQPQSEAKGLDLGGNLIPKESKTNFETEETGKIIEALNGEPSRAQFVPTMGALPREAVHTMADVFRALQPQKSDHPFCSSLDPRVTGAIYDYQLLQDIHDGKLPEQTPITLVSFPDGKGDYTATVGEIKALMDSCKVMAIDNDKATKGTLGEILTTGLTKENEAVGSRFLAYSKLSPPLRNTENTFEEVKPGSTSEGAVANIAGKDLRVKEIREHSLEHTDGQLTITTDDHGLHHLQMTKEYDTFIDQQVKATVDRAKEEGHNAIIFPGVGIGAFVSGLPFPREVTLPNGEKVDLHLPDQEPAKSFIGSIKNDLKEQIAKKYLEALEKELQGQNITLVLTDPVMKNQVIHPTTGEATGGFTIPIVTTGHSAIDSVKILMKTEGVNPLIVNAGDQSTLPGCQLTMQANRALGNQSSSVPNYAMDEAFFADFPLLAAVLLFQQRTQGEEWKKQNSS